MQGTMTSTGNVYNSISSNANNQQQLHSFHLENQHELSNLQQDDYQQVLDQNPLFRRQFTHIAQTSTAIQVAWSHPTNFQKGT